MKGARQRELGDRALVGGLDGLGVEPALGREPQHVGAPRPLRLEAASQVDRVDLVAVGPHVPDGDHPTAVLDEVGVHPVEDRAHLRNLVLARIRGQLDLDDVLELVRNDHVVPPFVLLDLLHRHGLEARVQEVVDRQMAHDVGESRLPEHRVTRIGAAFANRGEALSLHEGSVLLFEMPQLLDGPTDPLDRRGFGVATSRPLAHDVRGEADALGELSGELRVVEVHLPEHRSGLGLDRHRCLLVKALFRGLISHGNRGTEKSAFFWKFRYQVALFPLFHLNEIE